MVWPHGFSPTSSTFTWWTSRWFWGPPSPPSKLNFVGFSGLLSVNFDLLKLFSRCFLNSCVFLLNINNKLISSSPNFCRCFLLFIINLKFLCCVTWIVCKSSSESRQRDASSNSWFQQLGLRLETFRTGFSFLCVFRKTTLLQEQLRTNCVLSDQWPTKSFSMVPVV